MLRKRKNRLLHKSMSITIVLGTIVMLLLFPSCGGKKKITGDAITERDSMAVMQTSGVTTLISDSGVTRYRVFGSQNGDYICTAKILWTKATKYRQKRLDIFYTKCRFCALHLQIGKI